MERKKKIKNKELAARKKKKEKKRRKESSDSTQSEELFDVNVLKNIKTERLTDDEKMTDFSPRRQKPREIINVKELQNDFVGNNIHIKQEKIDAEELKVPLKDGKEEVCSTVQKSAVQQPPAVLQPLPAVQSIVEEVTVQPPLSTPSPVQKLESLPPPVEKPKVQPQAAQEAQMQQFAAVIQPTAVPPPVLEKPLQPVVQTEVDKRDEKVMTVIFFILYLFIYVSM